jgi:hypothetical protein
MDVVMPEQYQSISKLVHQAYPDVTAAVVTFNDVEYTVYTRNGKFHREDGPALICKQFEIWFYDGEMHCEIGPANIWRGEQVIYQWYFHGVRVSDIIETWLDAHKLLPKDPQSWTDQHKVYFKLTFSGMIPKE